MDFEPLNELVNFNKFYQAPLQFQIGAVPGSVKRMAII